MFREIEKFLKINVTSNIFIVNYKKSEEKIKLFIFKFFTQVNKSFNLQKLYY